MVFLCGGPPHQDMYDIKLDAPVEVRGEFDPIATNVPGIEICELLPRLAKIMDKLVPIRTVVGCRDDHAGYQCFTGHLSQNEPAGGWPHLGSVVSRLQGPTAPGVPPFVSLCYTTQHKPYNEPSARIPGPRPFVVPADRARDATIWCCKGSRPISLATAAICSRRSTASAASGTTAARWRAWTSSRSARWAF